MNPNTEAPEDSGLVDLSSWAKEARRRGELIEVYLINRKTEEVIYTTTNPHFLAGLMQKGYLTTYKLVTR